MHVNQGADANAMNEMGKTPLDWAIEQGHADVAKLIRDYGGIQGGKSGATQIKK
ncbi:MAG: ankyrin repeat domain-containing protein [Planctomycetes bacterium]|nr:ankyrin repeat domain-containing protein [Planctomycetota bacterium]